VTQCPEGYYLEDKKCLKCVSPCVKCLSKDKCLTCISDFNYFTGTLSCLTTCPDGWYPDDLLCQKCGDTCSTCIKKDICLKCAQGLFFMDDACLNTCPEGYFPDYKGNCSQCSFGCLTCIDTNTCTKCVPDMNIVAGRCIKDCSRGTFPLNNICVKCKIEKCSLCNSDTCLECISGYSMQDGQCMIINNKKEETVNICDSLKNSITSAEIEGDDIIPLHLKNFTVKIILKINPNCQEMTNNILSRVNVQWINIDTSFISDKFIARIPTDRYTQGVNSIKVNLGEFSEILFSLEKAIFFKNYNVNIFYLANFGY
jgi:hypothetical protein